MTYDLTDDQPMGPPGECLTAHFVIPDTEGLAILPVARMQLGDHVYIDAGWAKWRRVVDGSESPYVVIRGHDATSKTLAGWTLV